MKWLLQKLKNHILCHYFVLTNWIQSNFKFRLHRLIYGILFKCFMTNIVADTLNILVSSLALCWEIWKIYFQSDEPCTQTVWNLKKRKRKIDSIGKFVFAKLEYWRINQFENILIQCCGWKCTWTTINISSATFTIIEHFRYFSV